MILQNWISSITDAEGAFIGNVLQAGVSIGNVLIKGPLDTYS